MKPIVTKSVGLNIEKVDEVILEEKPTYRLIFQPSIHSNGIKGRVLQERRKSKDDEWKPDEHILITSIKKGHNFNFELSTEAVSRFYESINHCRRILKEHGIEYGENTYAVFKIDDTNKANVIEQLLQKGYSQEIWDEIASNNPDLAIRLSYSKIQEERERSLSVFYSLMNDSNAKERAWQEFFENNKWIFGYGLDYKFMRILQREFSASGTEADGTGKVIADYLMGDERFTTFVELKLPQTPLFKSALNRSGSWKLSNELLEAVSQILEQKARGEIKIETTKELHGTEGEEITNRAYNSKVILIIGNWNQIDSDTDKIKQVKTKTFELFRRELRNVEIITYDELFERAEFISNN